MERLFLCKSSPIYLEFDGVCSKHCCRGYIIDYLTTNYSAGNDTVVVYYFFDFSEKKSLQKSAFLRCILHQIITLETLLPDLQRLLESIFLDRIDQLEPTTSELERIVLYAYRKSKRCFLLIDGLDEVDEIEQRNIKSFLKKIQKLGSVRILATTHAAMDMSRVFTRGLVLPIMPEDLKDDIEVFIQLQIQKYSQEELSDCSPYAIDLIKQTLLANAEGM